MKEKTVASKVTDIVRGIYPFMWSFNGKSKDKRRLKYMINGYDYGDTQYDAWTAEIVKKLNEQQIKTLSVQFAWCDSDRGAYKALIIMLPL